jgi:hypothetical protein
MADALPLWLVLLFFAACLIAPQAFTAWLDRRAEARREAQAVRNLEASRDALDRLGDLPLILPPGRIIREVVRQSVRRESLVQGESFEQFIAQECGMSTPEGL